MSDLAKSLGLDKLSRAEREQLARELAADPPLDPPLVDADRVSELSRRADDRHAPLPWAVVTAGVREDLERNRP